ncbi:MAG: RIP metalloprotease RseP [Deltaproteobacteria bacterium]|jgi:regulator of sigma E protease|nr:RIP metalloprotease RseP [Deltaproteobacteria bacterium]
MLTTLISFLVLLIILIFVHELGHFLAAKLLGVKVLTFSLGFPPRLFSKQIGETLYQLAWIPIGGYVKLFGEDSGEEISKEEESRSFSHKPTWVKCVIVLAGPAFNLIFAIIALWLLTWAVGIQHLNTTLGPLDPESPLYKAGVMQNDVVTRLNGVEVKYFDELLKAEKEGGGAPLAITVERDGVSREFKVTPEEKEGKGVFGDKERFWHVGFVSKTEPVLGEVVAGKPARKAGLLPGDLVVSVNGSPTPDWKDVVRLIQGREDTEQVNADGTAVPVQIEVRRGNETHSYTIVPDMEPSQDLDGKTRFTPILGIGLKLPLIREPAGPVRSFFMGAADAWRMAKLTVVSVVKIFQNKISAKLMGGPIMIAEIAGKSARDGVADFVFLMAFISINLAIINLFPLPVLDGGQFVIFLIEGIKGNPISIKVKEVTQLIGIGALVALMVLVFYNDISRLVTKHSGPKPVQMEQKNE